MDTFEIKATLARLWRFYVMHTQCGTAEFNEVIDRRFQMTIQSVDYDIWQTADYIQELSDILSYGFGFSKIIRGLDKLHYQISYEADTDIEMY